MPSVLSVRLEKALDMLEGLRCPADIGCDHGYLAAALLERKGCERVAACDISLPSLEKAKRLAQRRGLSDRMTFYAGSGLQVLTPGAWDGAAILGMGGELIASILEEGAFIAEKMQKLVLQPMGGEEELRRYLYEKGFHVQEDVILREGRRYYQMLCVMPAGKRDAWPGGFPKDFFLVGYRGFERRDPLLKEYCLRRIAQRDKRLLNARGTPGEEKLAGEKAALEAVVKGLEGDLV